MSVVNAASVRLAEEFPSVGLPGEGLLEIYRRHGFDAGYHQALRDQLAGLVQQAERFLNRPQVDPAARKTLYAFVAQLEGELAGRSPLVGTGFEGGEGI